MASINANIIIDLPDGVDFNQYLNLIRDQISNLTGLETRINIREIDDPLSLSSTHNRKIQE